MNNNILYLVHATCDFNNSWKYLKPSNNINDEFPGVFFSLITKDNIKYEKLYIDDNTRNYNILIFSKKFVVSNGIPCYFFTALCWLLVA